MSVITAAISIGMLLLSRRLALLAPSTILSVPLSDSELACQNGLLMQESAIPGAYQQECMALSVRDVPLPIVTDNNADAVLNMRQGNAVAGSTGMAIWNSSLLLARILTLQLLPTLFHKQGQASTILELGCGPGLVSMALATSLQQILGATLENSAPSSVRILATDGNPSVLQLAAENIQSNQKKFENVQVQAEQLSWGLLNAMDYYQIADLVVGSDLTYNAANWPALAETMEAVLKKTGIVIYLSLGHAGFNVNAEVEGFLAVAQEKGLVQVLPTDEEWPFAGKSALAVVDECVRPEERGTLDATGGARVVVLRRKRFR